MAKHVIVLGAGVSGLGAAWRLAENGVSVDVLESQSSVGGLAGTVYENGYSIDYGPHTFFSDEEWVVKNVLDIFDYTLEPMPRAVKFFYKNKYLDYPLTAHGVLLQMGFISGLRVLLSFLKSKLLRYRSSTLGTAQETVEDWAISSFGEYLYRSFFKLYTEQFWKIPSTELSSRTIPTHTRMSFLNTLWVILHRRFSKSGESLIEREALPTYYPKTGFGEIPGKMAEVVKKAGSKVHVNCEVTGIKKLPGGKVQVTYNEKRQKKEIEADYVISTIPLTNFVKMLKPKPPADVLDSAGKIDYRSLVVLGMATEKQNILGCGYMYLLDRPFNRISEMNEFSLHTSPNDENIIVVEIPCLYESAAWKAPKEELFDMCIGSLAEDGFLGPGDVKRLILAKASHAYPIYRKNYAEHLNRLLDYVKAEKSLATLGRCGEFMYMDIDICIKRAFDFVDSRIDELKG